MQNLSRKSALPGVIFSYQRYTWHHAPEESKAAADAGYPYGFGDNLTVFTGTADAAQHAVDNWINSSLFSAMQNLSRKSALPGVIFSCLYSAFAAM